MKPIIIEGSLFADYRGKITYANDFNLDKVCRFYMVEHFDTKIIRAWQGHKKETKDFFPIKGKFVISWVKLDNFENPSNDLIAEHIVLDSDSPQVLHLPPGYANGFRALEKKSKLGVFSNMSVEQSEVDNFRFPSDKWFNWNNVFM